MRRFRDLMRMTMLALLVAVPASARTIIDEWAEVTPPAPPELRLVTIDSRTTALLLLDFNGAQDPAKGPCNTTRPRCIASIPRVVPLLAAARARGMLVAYSITVAGTRADIATDLAPRDGEAVVQSGPDKFIGTDLAKILADKGITTVVITGTVSEGAVLDTATDAALHGLNVIVPVDGMSSPALYGEQYVSWHLTHAPGVFVRTTLTRLDMIHF